MMTENRAFPLTVLPRGDLLQEIQAVQSAFAQQQLLFVNAEQRDQCARRYREVKTLVQLWNRGQSFSFWWSVVGAVAGIVAGVALTALCMAAAPWGGLIGIVLIPLFASLGVALMNFDFFQRSEEEIEAAVDGLRQRLQVEEETALQQLVDDLPDVTEDVHIRSAAGQLLAALPSDIRVLDRGQAAEETDPYCALRLKLEAVTLASAS